MQRRICGLCVAICAAAAVIAVPVASASAPTLALATTGPAYYITQTTAFLTGLVYNDGAATQWQFQYGTSTAYTRSTPLGVVPATVPYKIVLAELTGLKPGTTYHFRLAARAAYYAGYGYGYYSGSGVGADVTFKTLSAGTNKLTSTSFTVKQKKISPSLKCSSTIACSGKYSASVTTKVKGKKKTISCFSGKYSVKAGKTGKLSATVSKGCLALISSAKSHKLTGISVTITSSTGQPKVTQKVTLKS